LLREEVYY